MNNYFLLPGNPPALHFYEEWKKEILQRQKNCRVQVAVYPLLKGSFSSRQALDEVLKETSQQLAAFRREVGGTIDLIGHSLGGYFGLRLLEEHPDLVHRAFLIHPFLRAPSPRGWLILNSVSAVYSVEPIQQKVIAARRFFETFSSDLSHISDEELSKTFFLATHELAVIGRDRSQVRIRPELREKLRFFYTSRDSWCTPPVIDALTSQVPSQKCEEPHGFVTQKKHRESLFEKILADRF